MGHTPVLIPNWTLFVQMGIFFACYFALRFLVFKPYLELLGARKQRTVGLMEQASQDKQKAQRLQAEYDSFLKAERKKLNAWTDEERRQTAEEEKRVLQEARDAVSEELQKLRDRIQADADHARHELLPLVGEYSSQIASKLVGYKISVPPSAGLSGKTQPTVSQ